MKTYKWNRLALSTALALCSIGFLVQGSVYGQQGKWKSHEDLFSVSAPTEKEGWACGRYGTILHSSDGGETWARQSSGTDLTLTSIYFVDATNGWAVGNKGTILHTGDGGMTWERQESPVDYYHMGVFFMNPSKGFIVSERTHILGTDDGGKRWVVKFKDEDFILKGISFCDELHGWAVGEFGYTYCTRDGGEHWEKQGGYYDLDADTGNLKGDNFLFSVAALDAQTAWRVGILGTAEVTVDGGKTWKRVDVGVPEVQLFCVEYDGVSTVVIGGRGVCVVSKDKGQTWQKAEFEPPVKYTWIYHCAPVGAGGFIACGDEGTIYLKRAGSVWRRVGY